MGALPVVAQESCFALKGGTAINLFIRDMPRLSVDIDLTYIPVKEREESLSDIDQALNHIAANLEKLHPNLKVQSSVLRGTNRVGKLVVRTHEAQIKIEVSPVIRGLVFPSNARVVNPKVQDEFGYAEIAVVSFEDLYGGKLVAALDRQHPRDLYDVKLLLENEGITRNLFKAFLVYLLSHDRPMAEILSPRFRDITHEFENGFDGMAVDEVTLKELETTREGLVERIHSAFTDDDRELLLSVKRGSPNWPLLGIDGVETLPAVRWKLQNLKNLQEKKRAELFDNLAKILMSTRNQ